MESYGASIVLGVFEQSRPLYDMLELSPEGRLWSRRSFSSPGVNAWAMGFHGNGTEHQLILRTASISPTRAVWRYQITYRHILKSSHRRRDIETVRRSIARGTNRHVGFPSLRARHRSARRRRYRSGILPVLRKRGIVARPLANVQFPCFASISMRLPTLVLSHLIIALALFLLP